jgi:carbon-monoxide dehydrogenase large subunit
MILMTASAPMGKYVGKDVSRLEDWRFVTGNGTFIGDIRIAGLADICFVRSVWPHARITGVDTRRARQAPGVIDILTAADLAEVVLPFTRQFYSTIDPVLVAEYGLTIHPYEAPVLAGDRVLRVGEPLAMVVAADRYLAEDAAELVDIDAEPRPALVNPFEAMRQGAETLHTNVPGNIHAEYTVEVGQPDDAMTRAQRRMRRRFRIRRSIGSPIETRGVIADFAVATNQLTVWSNTQTPHVLRSYLSEMLQLREDAIRVIKPDMGGSFGGGIYPEELAVAAAAILLRRPVRWLEDRQEDLVNARHSRDQWYDVEVGYLSDGQITALTADIVADSGAYNPFNFTLTFNAASHLRNQFDIENLRVHARHVLTNKQPLTPVRGAGRTEATFVMDRLIDLVAADLRTDPAEIRRRNLIAASAMPKDTGMYYRNGKRLVYDSGDYPAQLEAALDAIGYTDFRSEQALARRAGRLLGLGISSHVEGSGYGPHEGAAVRIDGSGNVTVLCGSSPQGQGHETVLAQVCADVLDLPPEQILVRTGDTALVPYGGGTFGSRSAVTAGNAVYLAAARLRDRIFEVAGEVLGADPAQLHLQDGRVIDAAQSGRSLTFTDLAKAATPASGLTAVPGLEASAYFVPPTVTFASGTHIAVVEVDPDLASVKVVRYVVVDDCGTVLNPMIVEGQQHGGVAHGIGNALLEEACYDDSGQFTTATFLDYLLPSAVEVPHIQVLHQSFPSPLNPLGVKGTGEGGASSSPAAVVNAIADALRPLRPELTELPLSPVRLFMALRDAQGAASASESTRPDEECS